MNEKKDKLKRVVSEFLSGKKSEPDTSIPEPMDELWKHKLKTHIALKHAFVDRFEELDRIAEKVHFISPRAVDEGETSLDGNFMKAAFSEDLFKTLRPKEKRMMKSINSSVIEKFLREEG